MKQRHLIFLLVLLTLFTACGEARPTPTPFAEEDVTEEALNSAEPLALSIADLAADPEAYADSFVEISGQYRRLPLLICDSDPHPAPATWQLADTDGSTVPIGGFGSQVRSLLPTDHTMTVVGVWQRFEGPVGCGKNATNTEIWYLKAREIVSPSPIARVTLTPTGSGTQIADEDGGTAVPTPPDTNLTPTPTPTGAENGDEPIGTPTLAGTTVPAPGSTPTTISVTPTDEREEDEATLTPTRGEDNITATATPTADGSATPTAGSGTPTPTGSSGGSGTPTATTAPITTVTRNPSDFDMVEFKPLGPGQPVLELLDAEQAHLYPIIFDYNGAITITAVAEPTMNIVLEIIDPANDVVQQANSTGNGGLEAIVNAQLNVDLDYQIRIYNLNDNDGDYCLMFNEGGGFPDTIKGRIEYGQTVTDQIEASALDYWCFLGSDGDVVSASAAATGSSEDLLINLFGPPDFAEIVQFTPATITDANLEANGMFLIGVLNNELDTYNYSLTLTKN